MRLKIIRIIIVILFAIISLDLFYVQVVRGNFFFSQSVNNRIRVIPLEGRRGIIKDRNGTVLADNRISFNVTVIPQDIKDKDSLFSFLSRVLKIDKNKLLQKFWQNKITPFAPVIVAEDVDKQVAMVLEENKFLFPGLYIQESFRRQYPFKDIGAHILGYVRKISRAKIEKLKDYGYSQQSMVGYSGIEEYYDSFLKGRPGGLQIEVNNRGQQVRLLSIREPEDGQDVKLTIDSKVQQAAAETLGERHGVIIVMDLETGEMLGVVSSPTYDPNIFVDSRLKSNIGLVATDPAAPLLNRAIQGQYPPGSIFKVIVSLAGLKGERITPYSKFFCDGAYYLGSQRFRCAHRHGEQNLIEAIAHSCNVYFYNVGGILGPDALHKYARMFGLGSLTHVDLPFEEKGLIPSRMQRKMKFNRGWYKGDTLNYSIGQGDVLTTPLQIVRMMAIVAGYGKEIQPHLIKAIGSKEIIQLSAPKSIKIKPEIFDIVQSGLRLVVADSRGTAHVLNMKDFSVFGKTGTAQTTKNKNNHAWFAGYDTSGKVKIAFCVFLEYGGSSYNACLLSRQLLKRLKREKVL